MDLYQDAIQLLLSRSECVEWPELQNALKRALAHRPVAWHFPVKACEAVGGKATDLNDSLAVPANVDWLAGRSPLPLLFAQVVDHPDRQRFIELRNLVADPETLTEAQTNLVRSGAISYSVNELLLRHSRAHELLNKMKLNKPNSLAELLDEAIAPVKHLFAKVGVDLDAAK